MAAAAGDVRRLNFGEFSYGGAAGAKLRGSKLAQVVVQRNGTRIGSEEGTLIFCHGGRDEGFDANLAATATTGKGAVVLINKNDNNGAIEKIMKAIATKYAWP